MIDGRCEIDQYGLMGSIFKCALKDTYAEFSLTVNSMVNNFLVFVFSMLLFWFSHGQDKAIAEFIDASLILGAILLSLILIFLKNLWLAPYRIMEDRLSAIENGAISQNGLSVPPSAADCSLYLKHNNYLLYEAACLWVGLEPHHPIATPSARAKMSQLKSAIRDNQLRCYWENVLTRIVESANGTNQRSPNDNQKVSAVALRRYAEYIDDVPEFLKHIQLPPEPPDCGNVNDNQA